MAPKWEEFAKNEENSGAVIGDFDATANDVPAGFDVQVEFQRRISSSGLDSYDATDHKPASSPLADLRLARLQSKDRAFARTLTDQGVQQW